MSNGEARESSPEIFGEQERLYERLGMAELIGLADRLAAALHRRFGARLALAFTDIVDSTAHFSQYGEESGRRVQHRHIEMLQRVVALEGGRIVDTAGDGAFLCFPSVDRAVRALVALQDETATRNAQRAAGDRLTVRSGVHWGEVLTDGNLVQGKEVSFAARVTGSGRGGEIRITEEAFRHLSGSHKVRCKPLAPEVLKGFPEPVSMLSYEWREPEAVPGMVRIVERNTVITLPDRKLISFGRSSEAGARANDVVITHPDETKNLAISRWHFVLRREPDGLVLRNDSREVEVDGAPVATGGEAPIRIGSTVRVAGVLTLTFLATPTLSPRVADMTLPIK